MTHAHSAVGSVPLFRRAFTTNAAAMLLAFTALVLTPVTVSAPIGVRELVLLAIGVVVVLALNLLLLRPAFRPLDELAQTMRRHDEVGQTLTGAMLQIEALAARIPDLRDELDELRETGRSGSEDVRRIAKQLRPEALEDLGLHSALATLATSFGDQAHMDIRRSLEPMRPLSKDEELVVYRVAQEALTNVVRHAQATQVELRLRENDARAVLTVRDDGCGLSAGTLPSANGIRGMRERAMLIGAQLHIDSGPGRGTEIKLSIPLDPEAS